MPKKKMPKDLDERTDIVVDLVVREKAITIKALVLQLGWDQRRIRSIIERALKLGLIQQTGTVSTTPGRRRSKTYGRP